MLSQRLTILAVSMLSCLALSAQEYTGGVKGTVVSRLDKTPVENAKLTLYKGAEAVAEVKTASDGTFFIPHLGDGVYEVLVQDNDFLDTRVNVTVNGGYVKNMFNLSVTPLNKVAEKDETDNAYFDMEDSGYQDNPSLMVGNNDIFNNLTSYNFSAARFRARGYDSNSQQVLLAGVRLNDAITGYSPFSLWSGLNEATRSKDATTGAESSLYDLGGYNGVANFSGMASDMRPGWRGSVLTNSAYYRLRLMLSYGSGKLDNGWAYAFNVSARLGGNDWVRGVYYRSFAYYAAVDKSFGDKHKVGAFFLASPGERGVQNGSTQEVYNLTGDNMYNSNWGYQNGKMRNSRVRKTHEPVTALKYDFTPNKDFKASATVLYRFGWNGYTALDWYDSYDPRPDYYRNLPSYFYSDNPDLERYDEQMAKWATEAWQKGIASVTHVDWDRLYNVNYYSDNGRSKYVQEERHVDQKDLNVAANFRWNINSANILTGGLSHKWNRSENYKKIADLLGGNYYLDINNFAERDYAGSIAKIQNDLDYWLANPTSDPTQMKKAVKGQKYGYDYYAHIRKGNAWVNYDLAAGSFNWKLGGSIGYTHFWREGLLRNGLFAGSADDGSDIIDPLTGENLTAASNGQTSKGDSEHKLFLTYSGKTFLCYSLPGGHKIYANVGYYTDAPNFNKSFISPRTRNTLMKGLTTSKAFSTDLNYQFNANGFNVRFTGYFTNMWDKTDLMSFYDDVQNSFTNFAMTGISEVHAGLELGFKVPLPVPNLSLQGALAWGKNFYTSNPYMTQTVDNSAETVIENQIVPYWKSHPVFARDEAGNYIQDENGDYVVDHYQKHYVPGTPQLAATLGLNYSINRWFFDVDVDYFAHSYISMNPLYRTDNATAGADGIVTPAEVEYMCNQEEFNPAFLVNLSVGRNWYIGKNSIGFSLQVKNLTNNLNIKTGGYEQTRLIDSTKDGERYYRFDSKYFYMTGINYMLNVYFRF